MTTESFSAMRWVLPLRRMPAVSTKRKRAPSNSTSFIDGVAGGAGDGGDDGAVSAGEGVEEGGFADVGAADDGDGGFNLLVFAVGAVVVGRASLGG